MVLLADFTITWQGIGFIFLGVGVAASAIAYGSYKFIRVYKKLSGQADENRAKATDDASKAREALLQKYKELYELKRERADREMADLRRQMESLKQEVGYLRERYREVSEEADKLRDLNVRLQQDKQSDSGTVEHAKRA
jgi:E3 ubiquitin-protein ligase DOA10